jgi:type II secretory pathway pseudopilin PulG
MRRRKAFTLFQLLLVLAVLAILLGLLVPAIHKVRLAAADEKLANNLKQLGLALHNYNDTYGVLPAGVDDNRFSAAAKLLPFIEEDRLFKKIDFKKSIDDEANAGARKVTVKTFLSPRDPLQTVRAEYGATNYLFNDKVFALNSKASIPRSFPDGTSNTIVTGETLKGDSGTKAETVRRQYVLLDKDALKDVTEDTGVKYFKDGKNISGDRCASWMDGRFLQGTFNGRLLPNDKRPDVSCAGAGGVSALRTAADGAQVFVGLGDGSTRVINPKISEATWKNAIDPADGNVLGSDW